MNFSKSLPRIVFLMCRLGGNLTGGCVQYLLGKSKRTNDWDIIVPPEKWYAVSLLIPKSASLNKHGGLRFKDEFGNIIDVWPCSIEQHLRQCKKNLRDSEYVLDYTYNRVFCSYIVGGRNEPTDKI